jgi:DNA topoisomerase-1
VGEPQGQLRAKLWAVISISRASKLFAPTDVKQAHLRYSSDERPGIRRQRRGKGFVFFDPNRRPVKDAKTLSRIKHLAIPPAWEDVWICPVENGHIKATGRDARGRKQYRYHERWREQRDENKFARILNFARVLPKIRRRVRRDLKRRGLPREKVLATIVRLLEGTLIRVGNDEYARDNHS